jgi:prepilin-type processing-associated H-X9-DG protein
MRRITISALVAVAFALPLRAQSLPPDLDAVPDSAIGFIHVRVADIWKGDAFKEVRSIIEKAGAGNFKLLDERFVPAPTTIDRVTVILNVQPLNFEPAIVFIVTTKQPFDREKLLKGSLTKAVERKAGNATYYFDEDLNVAVQAPSDTMVIFGPNEAMTAFLSQEKTGHVLFGPALREASGKAFTSAVNADKLPDPQLLGQIPPPLQAILKNGLVQITADLEKSPTLAIRIQYPDSEAADRAEKAVKEAKELIRRSLADMRESSEEALDKKKPENRSSLFDLPQAAASLATIGMVNRLSHLLDSMPVKRNDNSLVAAIDVPDRDLKTAISTASVSVGLLLPAVHKVREAAARTKDANNLKQIALAMHNYASANEKLPSAAICDKNGKPLLSWRVAILPYIEQNNLYQQFHLDEPWDSEHNIKLAGAIPPIYLRPIDNLTGDLPTTRYQLLVGNGAGFEVNRRIGFADITDGTSNTIMVVEAAKGVPWSKPEDIQYDPKKMPALDFSWNKRCQVAFFDGSVRSLSKNIPEKTWHLLFQRADGQLIPQGDLDK